MGTKVQTFLEEFQDMYVGKEPTVEYFPNNLTSFELELINQQFNKLTNDINALVSLTKDGSIENLDEYREVIRILDEKLDYVEDLSDMLLYINSYYDRDNTLDMKHYDLKNSIKNNNIIYDLDQKGITLMGVANNYDCPKEITNGTTFTYYNSNFSYHSGLILHSEHLDVLAIKNITLIKSDGLTIKLPFNDITKNTYYIKHDYLTSTQIIVEFSVNINALPLEVQQYYKDLKISLVDYEYVSEGDLVLEPFTYTSGRLFNLIDTVTVPKDTYLNVNLSIDLLDINENIIDSVSVIQPLGTQRVCKRLNNIDFKTVDSIVGIYINNKYKENIRDKITKDYLEKLNNKNEIYVIYNKKTKTEDVLNKYFTFLNNQGLVIKNKNIKKINVTPQIELFTFNPNSSPTLKLLIGITKT